MLCGSITVQITVALAIALTKARQLVVLLGILSAELCESVAHTAYGTDVAGVFLVGLYLLSDA